MLQLLDSLAQGVGGRHLRKARLPDGSPLFARGTVKGREVFAPPPLVDVLRLVPRTAPKDACPCSGASCRRCRNTGYTPADAAVLATPAVAPGDLAGGGDVADVWG